MDRSPKRIVVFAPNWLGDAVMAVPCLEMLKRVEGEPAIAVAARGHLAPLYQMVEVVDEVIELRPVGKSGGIASAFADARMVRAGRFDLAVLLPNSFRSALIARLAGVPRRRGYAADGRSWLLTDAVPRVGRVHMVEYYRHLINGVGSDSRDHEDVMQERDPRNHSRPHFTVPADARERARALLAQHGWTSDQPLCGMAPGAAYGTAKQWLPERFGQLAAQLGDAGVQTVLVGSAADREVCQRIVNAAGGRRQAEGGTQQKGAVFDLAGRTTLAELAAVVAQCGSFVTNDSGAMHVAVAVGVPVTALFGPTQEWETGPNWAEGEGREAAGSRSPHALIIGDVPCRPCMLRECPIEHQCMVAITVDRVKAAVLGQLAAGRVR